MDQTTPTSTLSGMRILVVEDEALLAFELVDELEAVGATAVESSPDVPHALNRIRSGERFDAAILNVWLRGQLSFPVAEELEGRGIPFVFVTGNDADATRQYPDVTAHPKPADMDAVVSNLATLIAKRENKAT